MREPRTSWFHQVVITVHTNRAITAAQARGAVWNPFALASPWSLGVIHGHRGAQHREGGAEWTADESKGAPPVCRWGTPVPPISTEREA
jgi:phage terminase large subunit-like protein